MLGRTLDRFLVTINIKIYKLDFALITGGPLISTVARWQNSKRPDKIQVA
jgi:hypothetical protein